MAVWSLSCVHPAGFSSFIMSCFCSYVSLASVVLSLSLWTTADGGSHELWLQTLNDTHIHFQFPRGFLWGVGSSAFPTEGSWDADGKGESVWDRFTHSSRMSVDGTRVDTADVASDSYVLWDEDVKAIQYLGVKFYAFSLSWPRLFPDGNATSEPNRAGVEHYRRLITRLKDVDVEPVVTLHHWDLPQTLQERFGGWLNPDLVDVFADYARFCFQTFGGEVRYWLTIHNPFLLAVQGYGTGAHAPGVRGERADPFTAAHNIIRAHAKAWHIYHKHFRWHQHGRVSITLASHWVKPLHDQATSADLELCQKSMEAVIGWFAEPIHRSGDYPASLKASNRGVLPEFSSEEKMWIRGTADFFSLVFDSETLRVVRGLARFGQMVTLDLRKVLLWVQQEYRDPDVLMPDSGLFSDQTVGVEDTVALYPLKRFISQLLHAVSTDGVKVFGYSARSLLDGFEWNHGYSTRRGFFYINFTRPQRHRIPKTSAHFYRQIINDNGFPDNHTQPIHARFPCDFQFGVSDSVLQVHLHPFSPQFTDPHVYRWNYSGDGSLRPVAGVVLHNRGSQCTDFLFIQRHLLLAEAVGTSHYRFALDWSELVPSGDVSSVDGEKLRFYRCVLSEVRSRGIQAVVTLYHPRSPSLGLPAPLHANSGWRNYSTVEAFIKYAALCFHEFGALVPVWITINEPNRLTETYGGSAEDRRTAARHMLLAHAKAWRVYRVHFHQRHGGNVSFALHADWVEPANPFLESHEVAVHHFLWFELGRFLDPLIGGGDPDMHDRSPLIGFTDDEKAELKASLDFIALNHFTTHLVSPQKSQERGFSLMTDRTWTSSPMGQAVVPWGLRRMLSWMKNRYGNSLPIIITASGVDDRAARDDQLRQTYIKNYLQEALKAREMDGVNLRGFYIWKLQDGHDPQFGLFTSATHHSRPKASVNLYRDIISRRGFPASDDLGPSCQLADISTSCRFCAHMTDNKPLLFFSVCVFIIIIIIIICVLRRRKRTLTTQQLHH